MARTPGRAEGCVARVVEHRPHAARVREPAVKRTVLWIGVAALVLVVAGIAAVKLFHPRMLPQKDATPAPVNRETELLNRGEYLARAGDCVACHTAPTGNEFAGGRAMP